MSFESKILNVELKKNKIHFIPNVVYAQVPTFETPNQILQLDLLVPQSIDHESMKENRQSCRIHPRTGG